MDITDHPSPNFGPRRGIDRPDMVILHYTAMETADAAIARLCDPGPEVSAHYLIAETGEITRLVPEEMRAWHAGHGAWGACSDINSHGVGIELANTSLEPFAEPQLAALEQLLGDILKCWNISPLRVLGHSDIAPGRKVDPGPKFPWSRLAHQNLARATPKARALKPEEQAFLAALHSIGYTAKVSEDRLTTLLQAFRLRFRPEALGRDLQAEDMGLAQALASQSLTS